MKKFLAAVVTVIVVTGAAALAAAYDSPYIGNSKTKKFHYASCSFVGKMNPDNRVAIYSVDEARQLGYVPCKRCKP